jgi:hypothetical protein
MHKRELTASALACKWHGKSPLDCRPSTHFGTSHAATAAATAAAIKVRVRVHVHMQARVVLLLLQESRHSPSWRRILCSSSRNSCSPRNLNKPHLIESWCYFIRPLQKTQRQRLTLCVPHVRNEE